MTLTTKYDIGGKVKIPYLGLPGRIISIFYGGLFIEYKIRFASNGEFKEIYFYEDELL